MNNENDLRPRWGTFSVIDHKDPVALIPEILLYDRLVFPVPTDDADRDRWRKNGWEPNLLDQRIDELGDLVHQTKWTPELREEWSTRWQRLKELGRDTEGLAMDLTPYVLAVSAWEDRVPPPVMIAAYQDPAAATKDIALLEDGGRDTLNQGPRTVAKTELHREVCVLLERRLEMPVPERAQRTYEKAIELAHDKNYQRVRRRLFEWEDKRVGDEWPTGSSIMELEEELKTIVDEHNELIRSAFLKTWKQRIFRVLKVAIPKLEWALPPLAGAGGGSLGGPAGGAAGSLATTITLKAVKAILPSKDNAGEALREAISVMYHENTAK